MKLPNLPLIQVLEPLCLSWPPSPKKSRPESKWPWYYSINFCSYNRFKDLLAIDEPHEWSERQKSGHTDLSVSRSTKARHQNTAGLRRENCIGFLPYFYSCSFSGLYCSFHVTAPVCGSLCASKVNPAHGLTDHPSREQRDHTVTWKARVNN